LMFGIGASQLSYFHPRAAEITRHGPGLHWELIFSEAIYR
jgi:hypothetical protein